LLLNLFELSNKIFNNFLCKNYKSQIEVVK